MDNKSNNIQWSENIILVDADYVDRVAFDLIVNFERIIGRPIPQADLARWIDCVALDGGLRQGDNHTQVVFIHAKNSLTLRNFVPGNYADELDGKAFCDHLGEFALSAYPVEHIVSADDYFIDVLKLVCAQPTVRRMMIIPDADHIYNKVRETLRQQSDNNRHITVFAMQPMPGGNFRQEILGYSLMSALGISANEIPADNAT